MVNILDEKAIINFKRFTVYNPYRAPDGTITEELKTPAELKNHIYIIAKTHSNSFHIEGDKDKLSLFLLHDKENKMTVVDISKYIKPRAKAEKPNISLGKSENDFKELHLMDFIKQILPVSEITAFKKINHIKTRAEEARTLGPGPKQINTNLLEERLNNGYKLYDSSIDLAGSKHGDKERRLVLSLGMKKRASSIETSEIHAQADVSYDFSNEAELRSIIKKILGIYRDKNLDMKETWPEHKMEKNVSWQRDCNEYFNIKKKYAKKDTTEVSRTIELNSHRNGKVASVETKGINTEENDGINTDKIIKVLFTKLKSPNKKLTKDRVETMLGKECFERCTKKPDLMFIN